MELSIQERLKDLRVERGLTLEQLEEQVNLSKSALGSYEAKDFKDISHYAIIKLAKFYGVTADYLLGLTDASVIDTDIRISCDTTGLSEKAVKILSGMEKSDVEKLSKLIEFYNTIR